MGHVPKSPVGFRQNADLVAANVSFYDHRTCDLRPANESNIPRATLNPGTPKSFRDVGPDTCLTVACFICVPCHKTDDFLTWLFNFYCVSSVRYGGALLNIDTIYFLLLLFGGAL